MSASPDAPSDKKPESASETPARRRRRWPIVVLVLLAMAIWFAPSIAMNTPVQRLVLNYVNPGLAGDLHVGSADVGWFSPVRLSDVRVTDADGKTVGTAKSVVSGNSLWALARNSLNLGTFRASGVRVRLVTEAGTSNLEHLIAPLLVGPSSPDAYKYEVSVEDGSVELLNADSGETTELVDVTGTVRSTSFGNAYPDVTVGLNVQSPNSGPASPLDFRLAWESAGDGPVSGRARLRGTDVSLAGLSPALGRLVPDARVAGVLKCDTVVQWTESTDQPTTWQVRGGASIRNLLMASDQWFGADIVRLESLVTAGSVDHTSTDWVFDNLRAKCDFGDITARGGFQLKGTSAVPHTGNPLKLSGKIDLADLANRLPATMHLRDGMQMSEGTLTVSVSGETPGDSTFWTGTLRTGRLEGTHNGRTITWEDPLQIDVRARNHHAGYVLDRVQATSDFLSVTGQGSLDDLTIEADCNLDELTQRVQQFVDLDAVRLAGQLSANATLKRDAGGRFRAGADVTARGFKAVLAEDQPAWEEPALRFGASASGTMQRGELKQLTAFEVTVRGAGDEFTTKLLAPIDFSKESPQAIPLSTRLSGSLHGWLARAGTFIEMPIEDARASINLAADVVVSPDRITIHSSEMKADWLRLKLSDGVVIEEPSITASAKGRIDLEQRTATLPTFEWLGSALQARGSDLHIAFGDIPEATARCSIAADLQQIDRWRHPESETVAVNGRINEAENASVTGRLNGDLILASKNGVITARIDATLENSSLLSVLDTPADRVAAAPGARPIGNAATLACTLRYNPTNDTLRIDKARVDSEPLAVQAAGTVRDVSTRMRTDVTGNLVYDFRHLNAILKSGFGDQIVLQGKGNHPFEVRGPLNGKTENLSAAATVSWDSATLFGLNCGAGEIDATVKRGVVRTKPVEFALNGGRARILPTLSLTGEPTLRLAKGTELRDVRLNEAVTNGWLRYVAPALADATRIHGRLSTGIANAAVPIESPERSDIGGAVWIHTAEASPGPMLQQLSGVIDQVRAALGKSPRGLRDLRLVVPEQKVAFRMLNQRVHHQNFALSIDGLRLETSGSVGLDQSLDLVAEFTVPADWAGNGRLARSLAGRPIRIPVKGTFRSPRIDTSFLRSLAGNAVEDAAGDLIGRELDKGINRLLDKIK